MSISKIIAYTDGSCDTRTNQGAWASVIVSGDRKIILKGSEKDTTHNRMELTAVIKTIEFTAFKYTGTPLSIYTDSQYVAKLPDRMEKLIKNQFITKKGEVLNNSDLLLTLISHFKSHSITFYKVKAHQKNGENENLNREADMICRRLMRETKNR